MLELVLSKFPNNDLLVVVGSILVGVVGNTSYLNSKVPKSQNSHHDTEIIDVDAFESPHARIPIGTPNYRIIHKFQVQCI